MSLDIIALVLFALLMAALMRIRRVREWHHGYYGAALCALHVVTACPVWVAWLGVLLILDDTVQHVAEMLGLVPRMADFTPLHRLGAWIMGLNWKAWGWGAPLGIALLLCAFAIFAAIHWGV